VPVSAWLLLVVAIAAGVLGFVVIVGIAASIAQILFPLFLILFVIALVKNARRPL